MFGLSSTCYDMVLFVISLWHFICVGVIQIDKANLISRRHQIIVVTMLKNWSPRYSSYYIIKLVGCIPIYYVINLNIILFCMVLAIYTLIYCKFELIILFFSFKKIYYLKNKNNTNVRDI